MHQPLLRWSRIPTHSQLCTRFWYEPQGVRVDVQREKLKGQSKRESNRFDIWFKRSAKANFETVLAISFHETRKYTELAKLPEKQRLTKTCIFCGLKT